MQKACLSEGAYATSLANGLYDGVNFVLSHCPYWCTGGVSLSWWREKKHLSRFVEMDATLVCGTWHRCTRCIAASPEVPLYKDIVLMSALNVLVFVRLVLAVQGWPLAFGSCNVVRLSDNDNVSLHFAAFLEIQVGMLALLVLLIFGQTFDIYREEECLITRRPLT